MTLLRVLLADDHKLVAEGLKKLLTEEFDLVGVVEDGRALIEAARALQPDVIVADISMPHINGIDAMIALKRERPDLRVVFLTMHRDVAYACRAIEAGALGFVLKHSAPAELMLAVKTAMQGQIFISEDFAEEVLQSMKVGAATAKPLAALTERQRDILRMLAEGRSAKEIALALGISSRTVEFHKYRLMDDVGVSTSAELIRFAVKNGIAPE